jgi:hypothetical protein
MRVYEQSCISSNASRLIVQGCLRPVSLVVMLQVMGGGVCKGCQYRFLI